jgi:hypothetical protein
MDHRTWFEDNADDADEPILNFHDDGYDGNGPGPGLEKALAVSHRYGPGVFIVSHVKHLCRSQPTAKAIVIDLVERGWRFVALADDLDTANNPNWPDQLRARITASSAKV